MRCPRCGNENPDGNRFCGMCGATLLTAPAVAETATQRAASASTTVPSHAATVATPPEPVRPATRPSSDDAPIISGPSFLGLSDPPSSSRRKKGSLSIDPDGAPTSRSLDYLLEDEEESSEDGGAGKYVVILLLLALAGAFGYMTWKNQGVSWLTAVLSKPPAATPTPNETDNSSPAPSSSTTAPGLQTPVVSQPAPVPAQPPISSAPDGEKTAANPAAAPPKDVAPAASSDSKTENTHEADDNSGAENTEPAATAAKPKSEVQKPAAKPPAAIAPAKPVDTVSEAQKYIYGRGVAQDCDRGLKLLKPAANAANSKAMIEMGALYSAGLCTPRDLPTAYRWFAIALRKDPANEAVQEDLQKLWSEMTQPERQLAIKLTQ